MIFCTIYFLLSLAVPAKATYHVLKDQKQHTGSTKLWSVYWTFYVLIMLLKCFLPFLQMRTFEIVTLLFFVWLYNGQFKGALYLKEYLQQVFEEVEVIKAAIDTLKSATGMLKIFEQNDEKVKSE